MRDSRRSDRARKAAMRASYGPLARASNPARICLGLDPEADSSIISRQAGRSRRQRAGPGRAPLSLLRSDDLHAGRLRLAADLQVDEVLKLALPIIQARGR